MAQSHPSIFKAYPETFGDILDYAINLVEDPEKKVLFRMSNTDISISYAAFGANVNRLSNFLLAAGVKKGDKVAVFLHNCVEYAYLFHALGKCGAVMVSINQFLRGEPIRYILEHSEARFLITTHDAFEDKLKPFMDSLNIEAVLFIDREAEVSNRNSLLLSDFESCSKEFNPEQKVSGSDIQGIWYTSGTTGLPKGVVIKHKVYIWRACYFSEYFRLNAKSVMYFILPMYHSAYAVLGTPMMIAAGGEIIQVDWFSASKFWSDVSKFGATVTASTGTIIPIMLNKPVTPEEEIAKKQLKLWIGWPVDDRETVLARWPYTKFVEIYGTTEAPIATVTSYDEPELGTCGPPAPYTDFKLLNPETGQEIVGSNQAGEIAYKHKLGPDYILESYFKEPVKTKETMKDGYWYSGDLGMFDERGNLRFVDRRKDYLRVGGENVSSSQIEALVRQHDAIAEAAVVGTEGELGHDEIVVHVVLKEGFSLDPLEFFEFCNGKMSYFMVPRFLMIRDEIPKTVTQRIEKYKLKSEDLLQAFDRVKLGYKIKR